MIVGDTRAFAIESELSCAYERLSFRGLGFFVIHLGGMAYGVRAADATLLACSFDSVAARIQSRGGHVAVFGAEANAGDVADAITLAVYAPHRKGESFFGVSRMDFQSLLETSGIVWAPDGDQAFDDRSCVVQFDVGERVRLIGFRRDEDYRHEPSSLRDIWLESDRYYAILAGWHEAFESEWTAAPKLPEGPRDG